MTRRIGTAVTTAVLLSAAALLAQSTRPHVDLHLRADRISLDEVTRLVPALGRVELPPTVRITRLDATGPIDRVQVSFDAASASGNVTGEATLDLRQPTTAARGTIHLQNMAIAELLGRPDLPEALTADARFDLRFREAQPGEQVRVDGTFDVSSPAVAVKGYAARAIRATGRIDGDRLTFDGRAEAYGADVRAEGRVAFGGALAYEVRGNVARANLARLPRSIDVPRTPTNLSFTFHVNGSADAARGRVVLADSQIAGARIARGTTANFEMRGGVLDYRAEGTVDNVDLQRLGAVFERDWLADERFKSRLRARIKVEGVNGALRSAALDVSDSAIFGGTIPQLHLELTPAGDTFAIAASGRFEGLDPGTIGARPDVDGRLTGSLLANGTVPREGGAPAFDAADVKAEVTLERSAVEGLDITTGAFVAAVAGGRRVEIQRAEIAAGDARIAVNGVFGLDPTVETSLTYHATTPALEAIADLIGQPVRGDLTVDGTVRGAETLTVSGTLSGSLLGYGTNAVRNVKANYTALVPRSSPESAAVEGHVEAQTLTLGTQTLASLVADARYRDRQTTFDVQATQANGTFAASGRYAQQDTTREASLTRLRLDTPAGQWTLAEGTAAVLRYDGSELAVENLRLTAAPNQSLVVSGRTGAGTGPLRVTARNVQLAAFAPWLNEPDLRGALDVDAEVRGALDAPRVSGTFTASAGAFRSVAYQTISGRADYDPQSLGFEVRFVQPDESWITAQGTLPSAVLTDAEARRTAPLDITVRSSPIGLAIVQALTTQINEVAGTLQADAVIRGTLDDPVLDGQLVVQGGAFSVPYLGTRYTGIDTTILLQPGSLVVDRLQLTDDDKHVLTMSGRLPIGKGRTGNLQLDVRTRSFEVIDNAYADLEVDAALTIAGDLTQPIVTGTIDVIGGRINADAVMTLGGGPDLYATASAAERAAQASDRPPGRAIDPPGSGLLATLPVQMDVRVRAPALIIAGRDLKGRGGVPIGLGKINVTADGDLTLNKPATGALRIIGQVETVRGTYEFQGREFELHRGGSIRFTGAETIDPILNVAAQRTIAAVRAEVRVTGTLRRPELELSSQPPLDRADILSLIVFNRPANELGAGERVSLSRRATAFATGYLAGEISEALGDAVGLDLFEIETSAETGDGLAPVLTVGEQLGDLYLRFQQQVGEGGGTQVVVEYGVTDWLRIETSVVERQDSSQTVLRRTAGTGIDAVMSWEYGGPADDEATAAPENAAAQDRRPFLYRVLRPRR